MTSKQSDIERLARFMGLKKHPTAEVFIRADTRDLFDPFTRLDDAMELAENISEVPTFGDDMDIWRAKGERNQFSGKLAPARRRPASRRRSK
jgi:hypothetical protein